MSLPLLLTGYAVSAAILVGFSIRCADCVDLLDKKTHLSGAFVGGVLLAAVTSLPELITSISAIFVVHNPELIVGNVLGSDIFNLCIFGSLTLFTLRGYSRASVGGSHLVTLLCTLAAYAATALAILTGFGQIPVIGVNVVSLVILVLYGISLRFLSGDSDEADAEDRSPLTVRQVAVRFVLMSLGLVVMSVIVTALTDRLSEELNLNASLAGALFLGIATSLPELSSSIALVKLHNDNAMVGNIAGSNIFNFTILSVADLLSGTTPVYVDAMQTRLMMIFGVLSTLLCLLSLLVHRRAKRPGSAPAVALYGVCSAGILLSYAAFLTLSFL